MALRNILTDEDPVLRATARPVTKFDQNLHTLLDDMLETMRNGEGVGLAAPQVGIRKRVVVIEFEDRNYEFINPVISNEKGNVEDYEGCLSLPGKTGKVPRPQELLLEYDDRYGEHQQMKASDWLARIICHETDHLDGILFIDRATKIGLPDGAELDAGQEETL